MTTESKRRLGGPQRPSWDEMGMMLADIWSRRSLDEKHRVGAVIMSNETHRVVGQGYNGRYPGSKTEGRASPAQGGSQFIHAEANALLHAHFEPKTAHTLYVTHEPCAEQCALMIAAMRQSVTRVVFRTPYESATGLRGRDILQEAGIVVTLWDQASGL